MAVLDKNIVSMSMPKAMSRGNPIALDASAVWYAYTDLENYAKTSPVAYVGQILSLVDEDQQTATAYIITDAAGTLQKIGTGSGAADGKTISLDGDTLALKNWGKQFYKWVDEGEGNGHHELVQVSDDEPWIAGLEPKSASTDDGGFVLEWYQPSTLTIEGVNSALTSLQQEVATKLPLSGGTLTGALTLADGSVAASESVVDTKIATAIGSAGHLKRQIVAALPDVGEADPDTIYMVLSDDAAGQDKYIEYMLIEGSFEIIGNTQVDLEPYMPKISSPTAGALVQQAADGTLQGISTTAAELAGHLANQQIHVTEEEKQKLTSLPAISSIGAGLSLQTGALTAAIATAEALGSVKIGDNLSITAEGTLSVPVATSSTKGVVMGSSEQDKVAVGSDGTLSINTMSVEKLVVPEGTELILQGGKA